MADITNLNQDVIHSWINCPPEILIRIFMTLDNKSLLTCLSVSQQWRAIADYIIQTHRDWKTLSEEDMVCGGVTFKRKSKLDWKDIYMNSLLWQNVDKADMSHVFTYRDITSENLNILNVHVYKDNLIVVTSSAVKYYDIETSIIKKQSEMSLCLDYNESDHIIITSYNISIAKTRPFKLSLFGKMSIDDDRCSLEHAKLLSDIWLYKLEDDVCYVLSDQNVLWSFTWNGQVWNVSLRARFYNNVNSVLSIHVHRDDVYLLVNTGHILFSAANSMWFNSVAHLPFDMTKMSPYPVMFGRYSVVCGVPCNEIAKTKLFNYADNFLMICPALSCATQHGHVLFLGFETGHVKICIYRILEGNDKPYILERNFHIRQYDKQTDDLKIIALNVYEVKNRQHLFISTRNCVYQVLLSYWNIEFF